MTSRFLLSTLLAVACFTFTPALAGTYKARCLAKPTFRVKITGDRLIIDDKAVPVQADDWQGARRGDDQNLQDAHQKESVVPFLIAWGRLVAFQVFKLPDPALIR